MNNQPAIDAVNSKFGAPMGRANYGDAEPEGKARAFKVILDSGGYDTGGAYWGHSSLDLYCITDGANYRRFIRAAYRSQAIARLGSEIARLKLIGGLYIFDNGGDTLDRYSVFYPMQKTRINGLYTRGMLWPYVGMSENPYTGIGQHGESAHAPAAHNYNGLGKLIAFDDLPAECQRLVMDDLDSAAAALNDD